MTPEQVAAARRWLEPWVNSNLVDADCARTIKALLDQPRVPDVCDHKAIDEIVARMSAARRAVPREYVVEILRIMHEPKRAATKEIEVEQWAVLDGEHLAVVFHSENVARKWATPACGKYTVVRLTGKAQVPA